VSDKHTNFLRFRFIIFAEHSSILSIILLRKVPSYEEKQEGVLKRGKVSVMAGGTGLYSHGLVKGRFVGPVIGLSKDAVKSYPRFVL
jgi:hypothetical protein